MSKQKAALDALLANKEERSDNSLRGKSLQRALKSDPPKTLTAFEWEEWYAEHGVPESHIKTKKAVRSRPWWRWW
jgi:hypothetical protein